MLENKFANNLRSFLKETGDTRMILAISGGPDSVCLLNIFSRFRDNFGLDIHVAHFNHLLRGAASDGDANFVKELCLTHSIPFHTERYDTQAFAREHRYSIEEAARIKRYEFLGVLGQQLGITTIVTGHHADDQVETVLMRILNGSSLDSLGGMSMISPLYCNPAMRLFRPFLTAWRWEVMKYLTINELPYRVDRSNFEDKYFRNKVRNRLIPLLCEEFTPAFKDNILQMSEVFKEDSAYFAGQLAQYSPVIGESDNSLEITTTSLPSEPSLRKRVLLNIFRQSNLPAETITFHTLNSLDSLLEQNKPSFSMYLKNNLLLRKDHDTIVVKSAEQVHEESGTFSVTVPEPVTVDIPAINKSITMRVFPKPENFRVLKINNPVHVDADKIAFPVTIRSRKGGDTFHPFGSSGSKKIKDYLIDKKINRFQREQIPIFTDDAGQIFWVGHYQIDSRFQVTEETRNILEISIKKLS